MSAVDNFESSSTRDWSDDLAPVGPAPTLDDLSEDARRRLQRFIVTATLERGSVPTAVIALYTDLAGEDLAVRYADQRFVLREMPTDWREVEERVLDLEADALNRGVDLAAAWRRATDVSVADQEPLEQLARLAGAPRAARNAQRSIFDDPDDLDELEAEEDLSPLEILDDRLPELVDLSDDAQQRIRRFAVEERLEHGLPPVELLELYRSFEVGGDDRARQYLDRVFVDHELPYDWQETQARASELMDLADMRGQDAGKLFADLLRTSPGMAPLVAIQILAERLVR